MITVREERMSDALMKTHLLGMPFDAVIHRFTEPDQGDYHDHPFAFTSTILYGGYVEEIINPYYNDLRQKKTVWRKPRDTFRVQANCIHKIIDLPNGECYTLIRPDQKVREPRFWSFEGGNAFSRQWNENEFKIVEDIERRKIV